MIVPTVGTVGRAGRAAAGDWVKVALFAAGGGGAVMLCLLVVQGTDGVYRVVVLADRGSMAVSLTVAAEGGFVGRVSDLDFPFAGKDEYVGTHLLTFFRCGGGHHRGGVFQGVGGRIWVEKAGRGDLKSFGIEDGSLKIHKKPFGVLRQVEEG